MRALRAVLASARIVAITAALLLSACAQPAEMGAPAWTDRPVCLCRRAAGEIALDGKLDEPAWQAADWVALAHPVYEQHAPLQETRAAFLWDDLHLYFAAAVRDANLVAADAPRDGPIWREDCIEFFLDPAGRQTIYYELDFSSQGNIYDALAFLDPNRFTSDKNWSSPTLIVRTSPDNGGWTLEGRIALEDLLTAYHIPPQHGDAWRVNVYRCDFIPDRKPMFAAWSPVANFHEPGGFGTLVFAFPERAADRARRERQAADFLGSEAIGTALPFPAALPELTVADGNGIAFTFHEETGAWRSPKGGAFVAPTVEADLPNTFEARNGSAPLMVRAKAPGNGRIVLLARLYPNGAKHVDLGRADGTILRLSGGVRREEMRIVGAVWQMAEVPVGPGEEVSIEVGPGPAGRWSFDKTEIAAFFVEAGAEGEAPHPSR